MSERRETKEKMQYDNSKKKNRYIRSKNSRNQKIANPKQKTRKKTEKKTKKKKLDKNRIN